MRCGLVPSPASTMPSLVSVTGGTTSQPAASSAPSKRGSPTAGILRLSSKWVAKQATNQATKRSPSWSQAVQSRVDQRGRVPNSQSGLTPVRLSSTAAADLARKRTDLGRPTRLSLTLTAARLSAWFFFYQSESRCCGTNFALAMLRRRCARTHRSVSMTVYSRFWAGTWCTGCVQV
jgi:hypothetical protein